MPARARRKMPKWTKAPEELVARFATLVAGVPGVQARKMFGYPAAFVNGYLFAGIFQEALFLRLSPDDHTRFMTLAGAKPFEPMPGRAMRGYVVVPPSILTSSTRMHDWLDKAFAHAKSLPPKARARHTR